MELVQIGGIPPLRQSTEETMSCQESYVATFIKGRKQPSGMDANRGTQIHRTMAAYVSHCARTGVGVDLDAFDRFSRGAGPQASKILVGLRDGFVVDFEHCFATEIGLYLDEEFRPTNLCAELEGVCRDSGNPAAHEGTLDTIYIFREQNHIVVEDYKSHMKPFDPDEKPQGKKYSMFILQHFPWAMTVTFRLVFVRYPRLTREITYTREQLPMLIDATRSARALQRTIHEDYAAGKDMQAIAGAHCVWCPLLSDRSCKIAEYNENMQLSMQDRVSWSLWNSAFNRINNKVLRDHVQGTGRKIVLRDYMGKSYIFGPEDKKSHVYPLFKASPQGGLLRDHHGTPILPIVDLLLEHAKQNPEDTEWLPQLTISATKLESSLKSNKSKRTNCRVFAHQAITDTADEVTKVKLKISKPLESEDIVDEFDVDDLDDEEEGEF